MSRSATTSRTTNLRSTLRFKQDNGALKGLNGVIIPAPSTANSATGIDLIYEFKGTAAQLNGILHDLQFDPFDRDPGGSKVVTNFTLGVTDTSHTTPATLTSISVESTPPAAPPQNLPPGVVTLINGPGSAQEYTSTNAVLGTLSASDPNGDQLTYKLIDGAGGRVKLVDGTKLVVDNGFLFDYEQAKSHNVVVEVSDGKVSHNETITIGVTDWFPEVIGGTIGNDVFFGGALTTP